MMGLDAMILVLWMLCFKPDFSLSTFTVIQGLFSSLFSVSLIHCTYTSAFNVVWMLFAALMWKQTKNILEIYDTYKYRYHQMVNIKLRLIIFFAAQDGEVLYSQQKQDWELTVVQIMNSLLQNLDFKWRT